MTGNDTCRDYELDARRVFDCLCDGGVAIIYMDVAYAILSGTEEALRRVYAAKARDLNKESGVVGNLDAHEAIQVLPADRRQMIRRITETHNLPLAVIAPYRGHPLMNALSPFLRGISTRAGTVNFLLNAGPLRDAIAALSLEANFPLIASSANRSHRGTKYRVEDIEPEVIAVADIIIDYGPALYMRQSQLAEYPLSSTQIDFAEMKLVRRGMCYDQIAGILADEFNVPLGDC